MEDTFRSRTYYLVAEDQGVIRGVLPLIHVKSLLAGDYVTSLPGGICTDDEEAARQLFDHARGLVDANRAKYLILRDGRRKWDFPDVRTDEELVTFIIEIPADVQSLKHFMKNKTRQVVNTTSDHGMRGIAGLENLQDYYPIYQRAMRELGTPTLGYDFFNQMALQFPGEFELITILYQNNIIGGGFIHPVKDTVFCLWSGLLHGQYKHHPSYLLIWKSINYAAEKGYRYVDLGRCKKNTGGYYFKHGFGGKEFQLYQQFYLHGTDRPPDVGGERKADFKYRIFVKVWRNLPIPVTEVLGPILRKQMPFG